MPPPPPLLEEGNEDFPPSLGPRGIAPYPNRRTLNLEANQTPDGHSTGIGRRRSPVIQLQILLDTPLVFLTQCCPLCCLPGNFLRLWENWEEQRLAYTKHLLWAVGGANLPSCITVPQQLWGLVPGPTMDTKIQGCSSLLYKMT